MNALAFLFPYKRLRRSSRLEVKAPDLNSVLEEDCSEDRGALGLFELLPLELKFHIFTYLSVEELSFLTITSKLLRNFVELYRSTELARRLIFKPPLAHAAVPAAERSIYYEQFRKCGLLLKRSTCLYSTKDRLKLLQSFLLKYLCIYNKSCSCPTKCPALNCYGKFLHAVIAGWDDKECIKTFETIGQDTHMLRKLESVVKYKPGSQSDVELQVRLFFRRVFLNHSPSKPDKAFWLNLVLRPFPLVHQARILFLLYGPMCTEGIQWYELCENQPETNEETVQCFGELANAFKLLHYYSDQWSDDAVISVIDELVCSPEEWMPENVAALLYLCGDDITVKVLMSKAINGRVLELAGLVVSLCVVCSRQNEPTSWAVVVLRRTLAAMDNGRDRLALLRAVVDTFHDYTAELHDYDADDPNSNNAGRELHNFIDVQAAFMWEMMQLAFSAFCS